MWCSLEKILNALRQASMGKEDVEKLKPFVVTLRVANPAW